METSYVYVLASKKHGTLYVGVTSNLLRRIWEHKSDLIEGFTKKYQLHCLVYYEVFTKISDAILREKQVKNWNRSWKIRLIESKNPEWKDLYDDLK